MDKKAKAEAKRMQRLKRKQGRDASDSPDPQDVEANATDESNGDATS
jgi:hypothetical protein